MYERSICLFILTDIMNGVFKKNYGHRPPILQTIQVRRTIYAKLCWSKGELLSVVLFWTRQY